MICPKCKTKTRVFDSATDLQTVYRRRRCPKCKIEFYTKENIAIDDDGLGGLMHIIKSTSRRAKDVDKKHKR